VNPLPIKPDIKLNPALKHILKQMALSIQDVREICQLISRQLGVGHSEKVYQEALAAELRSRGYTVEMERVVPIMFSPTTGPDVCVGYARLDILVHSTNGGQVVIELKAAASLSVPALRAQIQVYLKALREEYPGITGFGVQFMQPGTKEVGPNERVHVIEEDDMPQLISGPLETVTLHV
jgi:GxxExxY protein